MNDRDTPQVLRITVDAPPRREFRTPGARPVIASGAVLVSVVVLAITQLGGAHPAARAARDGARASGPAGVAAAYGNPLRCLIVSMAPHDPRFARADFDRSVSCGQYRGYSTAIFRRTGGMWMAVIEAISYSCPVPSLPAQVAQELGVCLARAPRPKWASTK